MYSRQRPIVTPAVRLFGLSASVRPFARWEDNRDEFRSPLPTSWTRSQGTHLTLELRNLVLAASFGGLRVQRKMWITTALGAVLGAGVGAVLGNVVVGIFYGVLAGIAVGAILDRRVRKRPTV